MVHIQVIKCLSRLAFATFLALPSHAQTDSLHLDSVFKTLNLQEVEVKSRKIRHSGDTVTYNASSYLSKEDKVLEDLLKKMPGISISADGSVNGKYDGRKRICVCSPNISLAK